MSFCYDNQDHIQQLTDNEHLAYLQGASEHYLDQYVEGIDRGVAIPAQAGDSSFDFTDGQKKHQRKAEKYIKLELFTKYKAHQAGKAVFKVPAAFTSQECANCGYTHPNNRKSQSSFHCGCCDHVDNADRNASLVIKKRAIKLL